MQIGKDAGVLVKHEFYLWAAGKSINHIQKGLAHRLFAAMVEFDHKCFSMGKVVHSEALEVTSQVAFQATKKEGAFFVSLIFIDSVCHITSFIMKANKSMNHKQTYITHGKSS